MEPQHVEVGQLVKTRSGKHEVLRRIFLTDHQLQSIVAKLFDRSRWIVVIEQQSRMQSYGEQQDILAEIDDDLRTR